MTGACVTAMVEYYDGDIKQVNHCLKMYGFAKAIADGEGLVGEDLMVAELSAVLHDIGIPEAIRIHGSSAGPYQERTGVLVGGELLDKLGCPEGIRERILFVIGHHHTYGTQGGGMPLQIIFEADFLVNLEEGNIGAQKPENVRDKFFQTKTGTRLINSLFGLR